MGSGSTLANPIPLATGKVHKLPVVPVQFRVYEDYQHRDPDLLAQKKDAGSQPSLKDLIPAAMRKAMQSYPECKQVEEKGWGKPKPTTDKWVYVFRIRDWGGATLEYEAYLESGNPQSYSFVSWTGDDRPNWIKKYPRPANLKRKAFLLDPQGRYYVFLSSVQLPYPRIDFYASAKGRPALERRAMHLKKGVLSAATLSPEPLDFPDTDAIADKAMARTIDSQGAHLKLLEDQAEGAKLYLAESLLVLSEKDAAVAKCLKVGAMQAFATKRKKQLAEAKGKSDADSAFFYGWMLTDVFSESRNDSLIGCFASDDPEIKALATNRMHKESGWLGGASTGKFGLRYLDESTDEMGWLKNLWLEDDGNYILNAIKGMEQEEVAKFLHDFIIGRTMGKMRTVPLTGTLEMAKPKLIRLQNDIALETVTVLRRMEKHAPELLKAGGHSLLGSTDGLTMKLERSTETGLVHAKFEIPGVESMGTHLFPTTGKQFTTESWKKALGRLGSVGKAVAAAITLGNAWCDIGSALVETKNGGAKLWNHLEAIGAGTSTLELAGTSSALFFRQAAKKAWEGIVGTISIVISAIDMIFEVAKAIISFKRGQYSLGCGYLLSVASLGFGIAAIVWKTLFFGIIGLALGIIAAIIIAYFTESEFQIWLRNCCWGTNGDEFAAVAEMEKQLHDFHGYLSQFKAEFFIYAKAGQEYMGPNGNWFDYTYYLALSIETHMFLEGKSKFIVNVGTDDVGLPNIFGNDDVKILDKGKGITIPDAQTQIRRNAGGGVARLLRLWPLENVHPQRVRNGKYAYELVAKLDFRGDGKSIYPDPLKGFATDGVCELRYRI